MNAGVRERARLALRTEIATSLSRLFAERGFDAVTVEDAASEVGISRATFFRYFGSKEDAVLAAIEDSSIDFGAVLTALPCVPDESTWDLLARTFRRALSVIDDGAPEERARLRMIHTTPSLRARLGERRRAREESLAAALEQRTGDPALARGAATASLAVVDLAWQRWSVDGRKSLDHELEHVFTHLVRAGEPLPVEHPAEVRVSRRRP